MGSSPYANGGRLRAALPVPPLEKYALAIENPAHPPRDHPGARRAAPRHLRRDHHARRRWRLPAVLPGRDRQQPARRGVRGDRPLLAAAGHRLRRRARPDGRVMEVLSEHLCEGWLEGYLLSRAARAVRELRGVRDGQRLDAGPARQVAAARGGSAVAGTGRVAERPADQHLLAQRPQRFQSSGPGHDRRRHPARTGVVRIWLPPDSNTLLSIADHCLRSTDHVNLIVVDKQPHLQYLTLEEAHAHCAAGASVWEWAGTEARRAPTRTSCSRPPGTFRPRRSSPRRSCCANSAGPGAGGQRRRPDGAAAPHEHPHGFDATQFLDLFTADTDVVFAFHGYSRAVHELMHGRPDPDRFHVRGFNDRAPRPRRSTWWCSTG